MDQAETVSLGGDGSSLVFEPVDTTELRILHMRHLLIVLWSSDTGVMIQVDGTLNALLISPNYLTRTKISPDGPTRALSAGSSSMSD